MTTFTAATNDRFSCLEVSSSRAPLAYGPGLAAFDTLFTAAALVRLSLAGQLRACPRNIARITAAHSRYGESISRLASARRGTTMTCSIPVLSFD